MTDLCQQNWTEELLISSYPNHNQKNTFCCIFFSLLTYPVHSHCTKAEMLKFHCIILNLKKSAEKELVDTMDQFPQNNHWLLLLLTEVMGKIALICSLRYSLPSPQSYCEASSMLGLASPSPVDGIHSLLLLDNAPKPHWRLCLIKVLLVPGSALQQKF